MISGCFESALSGVYQMNGQNGRSGLNDYKRTTRFMPCLLALLMIAFPLVALVLAFFFSNMIDRAYSNILIPVVGFFILPLTTLLYAWLITTGHAIAGINLGILIVAVLVDLGLLGGGWSSRQRR